ncbi:MAG: hypothetical protein PQJ59_17590 [Spirochaetales bacterium]|nr:hypothetical protein [Spirochaetales bacterium]
MRQRGILLLICISFSLQAREYWSLSTSLLGEWDEGEYESLFEGKWAMGGNFPFNWDFKMRGELDPVNLEGWEADSGQCGLAFKSPWLTMGSPSFEGLYDVLEGDDLPSFYRLENRARFSLDLEGDISSRQGILFHTPRKNIILHGLVRDDYRQIGLARQGDGESLSWSSLLLYSWDWELTETDSWYVVDDGEREEPLFHSLLRLSYELQGYHREWQFSLLGTSVLSEYLLPGYGGYFVGRLEGARGMVALGAMGNGGYWRSARGEPAEWSCGMIGEGALFMGERLLWEGSGALYRPGVFSLEPGSDPYRAAPTLEGDSSVEIPYVRIGWEGEYEEDIWSQEVKGELFCDRDPYWGTLSYYYEWGEEEERLIKAGLGREGDILSLEGQVGLNLPFDEDGYGGKLKARWRYGERGQVSFVLGVEGEKVYGEITLKAGNI